MRIPSGDLSPSRGRRYGGSYGRRRRRRNARVLAALLVAGLAGAAAYTLLRDDPEAQDRLTSTPCPSTSPSAGVVRPKAVVPATVVPRPQLVRLVLLNGTPRNKLAVNVGNQLAARGFTITRTGNAPAPLAGPSTVTFGPGALPAATLVSRTVRGSTLVSGPRAPRGSVQVVLGGAFVRLASPAEVAAAARSVPVGASTAAATPVPTPSRCR